MQAGRAGLEWEVGGSRGFVCSSATAEASGVEACVRDLVQCPQEALTVKAIQQKAFLLCLRSLVVVFSQELWFTCWSRDSRSASAV